MNRSEPSSPRLSVASALTLLVLMTSALLADAEKPSSKKVQEDPGTLESFKIPGQQLLFDVTGSVDGSVWGADVYTSDSHLATAAVHAGVLKLGERGIVKVTMLAGQSSYEGSSRNGVESSSFGEWEVSYHIARSTVASTATPTDADQETQQPPDDVVMLHERVNVSSEGRQGNGDAYTVCGPHGVSADGRYVTFASRDDNLVPNDTNSCSDIFVRDRNEGVTTRVSLASDGTEGDGESTAAQISADGRYVCFHSRAKNLAEDVQVVDRLWHGLYLHDRQTGNTFPLTATREREVDHRYWHLSANGHFVVYSTGSGVFVYDQKSHSAQKVNPLEFGDEELRNFECSAISSDGQQVAFIANSHIYLLDRSLGGITLVTRNYRTNAAADDPDGEHLTMSPDGRYLSFSSRSSELVPRDTNRSRDVFLYDHISREIARVSVSSSGGQGTNRSESPSISSDGRRILFQSQAKNLVTPHVSTFYFYGVFLHDRIAGTTQRIDVNWDGSDPNGSSSDAALSADGQIAVFQSSWGQFVKDDPNEKDNGNLYAHRLSPTCSLASDKTDSIATASGDSSRSGNPFASDSPSVDLPVPARLVQIPTFPEKPVVLRHQDADRKGDELFLAFSPNGRLLATATAFSKTVPKQITFAGGIVHTVTPSLLHTRVRIWDLQSGQLVKSFEHIGEPHSLVFLADGQRVCSFSVDAYRGVNNVHVCDINTGRQVSSNSKGDLRDDLVVAPNGRIFACGSSNSATPNDKLIFDTLTGRRIRTLTPPNGSYTYTGSEAGAFSKDGRLYAANNYSRKQIHVWDIESGKLLSTLSTESTDTRSLVFHPDGSQLALVIGSYVSAWDVRSGRRIRDFNWSNANGEFRKQAANEVAFSLDGRRMVIRDGRSLRIWDYASGTELLQLEDDDYVTGFAYLLNGGNIAVNREGELRVWSANTIDGLIAERLAGKAQPRAWTDATSGNAITASCVGIDNEHVWLRRNDDKVVRIAISVLSPSDHEHAIHLRQLNEALQPFNLAELSASTPEKPAARNVAKPVLSSPAPDGAIEGEWRVVEYNRTGRAYADKASTLYRFKNGRLTVIVDGTPSAVLRYMVDTSKTPHQLDLTLHKKNGKQLSPMIFRVHGDELLTCYAPSGQARPDNFTAAKGSTNTLIRMRRQGSQ